MIGSKEVAAIRRLPVFQGCDSAMLDKVIPLLETRVYRDGDSLCHEGAQANELFVLLAGSVGIWFDNVFLVPRGGSELVGEQALIEGTVRGATVKAQGMVKALVVPRPAFERLMLDTAFALNLMQQLSRKLNQATGDRALRYRYEHLLFGEFRSHVSPEVLQRLLASGEAYGTPQLKDAVILLADVRGFTAQSARMQPADIATQLTEYLNHAVEIMHQHGGLVDKFIGDAVMAVWGFVPSEHDMVQQALDCARHLVGSSAQFRFGDKEIELSIGLNAGEVFMGIVGGEGKRQFTVLGTPVNLTARYQSLAGALGVPILMGPEFEMRLNDGERAGLIAHPGCEIKGAETQTLYSWSPAVGGAAATQTQEGVR